MRTLHVAALPFPSSQGTQALIHSMLSALAAQGDDVHLLCYPHGAGEHTASYRVHRARSAWPARSLRSGPSLEKIALDAALLFELRRLLAELAPDVVVAHHVEAAACALAVSSCPVVYLAHTSLEAELPSYLPRAASRIAAFAGARLERALCRRSACTLAVSPLLADMLGMRAGISASALPLPWTLPPAVSEDERASARARLGMPSATNVLLYAGNLDPYQGLSSLVSGLARLRSVLPFVWLIATEGRPSELTGMLADAGLSEHVRFVTLASECQRRLVHAACDAALVPRGSPGGIPIKLLDALARGAPVLASQRACAGLGLERVCEVVADDDPEAWANAAARLLSQAAEARVAAAQRGRAYIAAAHDPFSFVRAFRAALAPLPSLSGVPAHIAPPTAS